MPDTADIDSQHVLTLTHCLASVVNEGELGPAFHTRAAKTNCSAASLTITVDDPPTAAATAAVTRKSNPSDPSGLCDLALIPGVTSDPRLSGITQIRVAFNVVPGDPPASASGVTIDQRTCAAPTYVPYSGASTVSGAVVGNELVLTFAPALENGRTYRLSIGPDVTTVLGQQVQVRSLMGDVNSDGFVNSTDRSVVIAVWTAGSFSCATDVNSDGFTNGTDRSLVVAAWTGPQNCAP